jgi:hypothetical protein
MTLQWSITGEQAMTRKAIYDIGFDIGAESAAITGAFFRRNVVVLTGLLFALLVAFSR